MKRILLIDDDPDLLETLTTVLQSAGYEIEATTSGQKGLLRAFELLPDLVICDVFMPDLEGTTVLQALRGDPSTAGIQVVLITGDPKNLPVRAGMSLGADDYLVKPFSMTDLLRCIEARMRRGVQHRKLESQTLDKLRRTLRSTLPHEFFTPVAGIINMTSRLRTEGDKLSREETSILLRDIERLARRHQHTLSNYLMLLELQAVDAPMPTPALLPVTTVVDTITEVARNVAGGRDRGADLQLELQPMALAISRENLTAIVEELVDNACKFSPPKTPVTVRLQRDSGRGIFSVVDRGPGLSPSEVEQVMSAQPLDLAKGAPLGLGLALVQKLASRHGSQLRFESQPGVGTTCGLLLPA